MIYIDSERCDGCGRCLEICPSSAIALQGEKAIIEESRCTGCEVCLDACPQGAILAVELVTNEPAILAPAMVVPMGALSTAGTEERLPSAKPRLRDLAWPVIGSTLLWAGREIVPRMAPLALDLLDQRIRSTAIQAPTAPLATERPAPTGNQALAGRGGGRGRRRGKERRRERRRRNS
jgi:NAD-dependent dihydropyrimidine dehydrogenase PreA subunit